MAHDESSFKRGNIVRPSGGYAYLWKKAAFPVRSGEICFRMDSKTVGVVLDVRKFEDRVWLAVCCGDRIGWETEKWFSLLEK